VGSAVYVDATNKINEAIDAYTSSIVDLGAALGLRLLEETKEIQKSISHMSNQIRKMSMSSEAHFQTLYLESQTASSGIDRLIQENLGKFLCSQPWKSSANIYTIEKEARETEKRFNDWLSYSVKEVEKEKRKNFRLQTSSSPAWVFDLPEFRSWLEVNVTDKAKMLWLSGTTGFGKSVLAAYVTTELARRFPSAPVTFFFCKDNEFLRDAHNVMRTFLYQVAVGSPKARAHVKKIWQQEDEFQELSEIEVEDFYTTVVDSLLGLSASSTDTIFFILDGINECPRDSCKEILTFVRLLQNCRRVHMLLTSQPTPDIITAMTASTRIELHEWNNQDNIDTYVKKQLTSDPELLNRFHYVQKDPLQFFREKHKGMFLWVSTVLKYLPRTDSDDDFERILSKVPDTMSGLYQEGLKRLEQEMSEDEKRWIHDIFCLAVTAKRNLHVAELEVALSLMRQMKSGLDKRPKIWDIKKTLSRCGAFLHVVQLDPGEDNKSISLVHDSFKLFITDGKVCQNEFLVNEAVANMWIVRTCLSYISTEVVSHYDDIYIPKELRARLDYEHPLFSYATLFWSSHLPETMLGNVDEYQMLINTLRAFWRPEKLCTWIRNVLAYSDQSIYQFRDSHLHSVVSAVTDVLGWLRQHNIQLHQDEGMSESGSWTSDNAAIPSLQSTNNYELNSSDIVLRTGKAVALVWLTGNPKYYSESSAAFKILELLCDIADRLQPTDLQAKEVRSVKRILRWVDAVKMNQDFRWFANIGHAYKIEDQNVQMLRTAIHYYEFSLVCGHEGVEILPVLCALGSTLLWIYAFVGSNDDLNRLIEVSKKAVALTQEDNPGIAMYANSLLGDGLRSRFELLGSIDDLNESIEVGKKAVALTPDDHPYMAMYANTLGMGQLRKFERTGSIDSLNESIEMSRKAITLTADDQLDMAMYANTLSIGQLSRFEQTGSTDDLNESIEMSRKAVTLTPDDHPNMAMYANNLGVGHLRRFEQTGLMDDLNELIEVSRRAVTLTPDDHLNMAMYANTLGLGLRSKFEQTGLMGDLNESIDLSRKAVALTPDDNPNMAVYANNLGIGQLRRFEQTGLMDDLNESIELSRRVVTLTPDDHLNMAMYANTLSIGQLRRLEQTGLMDDLNESIEASRKAVALAPDDHHNMAMYANNLGAGQLRRFEQTGLMDDLNESIEVSRRAVTLTPDDHPNMAMCANTLGLGLRSKFEQTGLTDDLNESIDLSRKVVALTPDDHPNMAMYANTLGLGLRSKFEQTGSMDDLNESIEMSRKAVALTPDDHLNMAMHANNLGHGQLCKFEWTGSMDDLNESIKMSRKAVALTPDDHPNMAMYANNLVMGLAHDSNGDFDKLIDTCKTAIRRNPTKAWAWKNLGWVYELKEDNEKVIETYKAAVEQDLFLEESCEIWQGLGNAYIRSGDKSGLIKAYRRCTEQFPKEWRAWQALGQAYMYSEEFGKAIEAYETAVEMDPTEWGVWETLGDAYNEKGDLDGVIKVYKVAAEKNPTEWRVWKNLGNAYSSKGEYENAGKAYENTLKYDLSDWDLQEMRDCWEGLGETYVQ
jgi:tetratricopeptide (TPR) repeat protein